MVVKVDGKKYEVEKTSMRIKYTITDEPKADNCPVTWIQSSVELLKAQSWMQTTCDLRRGGGGAVKERA